MPPGETDIGSAELEALRVLWEHGPATVREVLNRLHEQGRPIAYTTVLTFLTRLERKGFVRRDEAGVAHVYHPAVTREQVSRTRLKSLLDELYDGAAAPLVLQLVKQERFTDEEFDALHRLVDELDRSRRDVPAPPKRGGRTGRKP